MITKKANNIISRFLFLNHLFIHLTFSSFFVLYSFWVLLSHTLNCTKKIDFILRESSIPVFLLRSKDLIPSLSPFSLFLFICRENRWHKILSPTRGPPSFFILTKIFLFSFSFHSKTSTSHFTFSRSFFRDKKLTFDYPKTLFWD